MIDRRESETQWNQHWKITDGETVASQASRGFVENGLEHGKYSGELYGSRRGNGSCVGSVKKRRRSSHTNGNAEKRWQKFLLTNFVRREKKDGKDFTACSKKDGKNLPSFLVFLGF